MATLRKLQLLVGFFSLSLLLSGCGEQDSAYEGVNGTDVLPTISPNKPSTGDQFEEPELKPDPTPEPELDLSTVPDGQISVDGKLYTSVTTAASALVDGSTMVVGNGIYNKGMLVKADNVTIQGSGKTHFKGAQIHGKATFVVDGDAVTIENIECSQVAVPDNNGACVRQQGRDLTLNNVYFHDSQQGILSAKGTGDLTIAHSRFERLGKLGRAHGIYSHNDTLNIRYSQILSSKDQGHEVKSRAKKTVIEFSVIASLNGNDSRLLDISNGGELVVRNSVIEQGPRSVNYQMIGFAVEGPHTDVPHSVLLEDNIILMDHGRKNVLLGLPSSYNSFDIEIRNNDFIGSPFYDSAKHNIPARNELYSDRQNYGLDAYPALPDIGIN